MDIGTILQLVQAGVTTFEQIRAAHQSGAIAMTDEQLNELADALVAEDLRRAEIARKQGSGE